MAVSEVSICRLALSWLGANKITSLDEESVEAELCKENYDAQRDAVLEEADWSFAFAEERLIALASPTPLIATGNYFTLPPDCIRVVSVYDTSGTSINLWEKRSNRILAEGDAILIEYIKQEVNPKVYSPAFVQALAARLAAVLAPTITNSKSMANSMWELYGKALNVAVANDGLQGGDRPLGQSSLVDVRRSYNHLGQR